jgi:hypothetical protein
MPARLASHDGAKLFEHGFILLQCRGHLIRSDPRIRIQTFGLQFQLFAGVLLEGPVGNPGHHLGVAGAEARQTLGAEPGIAVGDGIAVCCQRIRLSSSFQLPAPSCHGFGFAVSFLLPAASYLRIRLASSFQLPAASRQRFGFSGFGRFNDLPFREFSPFCKSRVILALRLERVSTRT